MSKVGINTGSAPNAGDGSSLLAGANAINDNFNEIYTAFGNGSTLTAPLTAAGTSTLTNKTIDLDANTITGTLAEFNTALQGDSFASLTGSETLTNKTFTSPTINTHTFSSGTSTSGMSIGANGIVFEGATADAHETTLTAVDPTQDNTITIPNETMTAITTATHATQASHIVNCIALG